MRNSKGTNVFTKRHKSQKMKEVALLISYTKSPISTLPKKSSSSQWQATRDDDKKRVFAVTRSPRNHPLAMLGSKGKPNNDHRDISS
jgi:hypothetical protein